MLFVSTRVMVPSSRKYFAMSGVVLRVRTMGTGSAIPVVSTSTASRGLPFSICLRMESKAPRRSPRTVQHMQPFSMTTTCSAKSRAEFCNNSLSMGTAPNSFSMTANFLSRWCFKRWFSTVVFPAPRKPVKMVMGTGLCEPRALVGMSSTTDHFSSRTSPNTRARSPVVKFETACSCGATALPLAGLIRAQTRKPKPLVAAKRSMAEASCRTVQDGSKEMLAPAKPLADAGNWIDEWNPIVTCAIWPPRSRAATREEEARPRAAPRDGARGGTWRSGVWSRG
mmetsp:Transcript_97545/g.281488  ORF Transcript_97545/g.281488 Transcript_97545/m.281488 type:complete len:282 (+) Transcript_97545:327-1172(+)